jgi:hypothetical protein
VLEVIAAAYHSAEVGRRIRLDGDEARALAAVSMGAVPTA